MQPSFRRASTGSRQSEVYVPEFLDETDSNENDLHNIVPNLIAAETGPLSLSLADVLDERILLAKFKGVLVPSDSAGFARTNSLYSCMAREIDKDNGVSLTEEEKMEAHEDLLEAREIENPDLPLWQLVDSLMDRQRQLKRWQQEKRNGHRDLIGQEEAKEIWSPFWQHYRGDSGKTTHVRVATMRACAGPRAVVGKHCPFVGAAAPVFQASESPDKPAVSPVLLSPVKSRQTSFASGKRQASHVSQGGSAAAPLTQSDAVPTKPDAKLSASPGPTNCAEGFPHVSGRILQEYACFEYHERGRTSPSSTSRLFPRRISGGNGNSDDSPEESPDEHVAAEWWTIEAADRGAMHKTRASRRLSFSAAAKISTEHNKRGSRLHRGSRRAMTCLQRSGLNPRTLELKKSSAPELPAIRNQGSIETQRSEDEGNPAGQRGTPVVLPTIPSALKTTGKATVRNGGGSPARGRMGARFAIQSEQEVTKKQVNDKLPSHGTMFLSMPDDMFAALKAKRFPAVLRFKGFDDYKRHKQALAHSLQDGANPQDDDSDYDEELKSGDLSVAAMCGPQRTWSTSLREHEIVREMRRRQDQPPQPQSARAHAKVSREVQQQQELQPQSARAQLESTKTAPSRFFNRPWSREKYDLNEKHRTTSSTQSMEPIERFAAICRSTGTHPKTESVHFVTKLPPKLDLRDVNYSDEDVLALAAALPYEGKIEALDIGENPRITDKSVTKLIEALALRHSNSLCSLRLAHCNRLCRDTIRLVNRLIQGSLRALQKIDLSGLAIGMQEYLPFSLAVKEHPSLFCVRLVETGLGISDRTRSTEILQNLTGNPRLSNLDIGWNSLGPATFKALGAYVVAHTQLHTLGLSNTAQCKDFTLGSSPVLLFLECLAADQSLTSLDISNNALDDTAPLVLECAVQCHPKLQMINMSANQLGLSGRRSLLRMLANPDNAELTRIETEGCGGRAGAHDPNGAWNVDPSGIYVQDMAQPAQRALLRLLLIRFCEGPHASTPQELIRGATLRSSRSEVNFNLTSLRLNKIGVWEVPTAGELTYTLCAEKVLFTPELQSFDSAREVIEHIYGHTRRELQDGHKSLAVLCMLKREADEEMRAAWLAALSRDFTLSPEQVLALCKTEMKYPNAGRDTLGTCTRLLPSLLGPANLRQGVLATNGLSELTKLHKEAGNLLSLNLENPVGHYSLVLSVPADRATFEQLLLVNRWENCIWKAAGKTDISQNGNFKNFRNEMYARRSFVWGPDEWQFPGYEEVSFDYVSLRRPTAESVALSSECMSGLLPELTYYLYETLGEVGPEDCYTAVRGPIRKPTTSNNRFQIVRQNTMQKLRLRQSHRWEWDRSKVAQSDACAIAALRGISAKLWLTCDTLRELLSVFCRAEARSEALAILLFRTIDWPVNNKCIKCKFTDEQWGELVRRLGFLVMFPYFQPENAYFQFDFTVWEQRRAMHNLVCIGISEDLSNIKNPRLDWNGLRQKQIWVPLSAIGVPPSWKDFGCIPTHGLYESTYMCSLRDVRLKARRKNAATVAGWAALPQSDKELEQMITWWAVLDEVPSEVMMIVEFLFSRYADLGFDEVLTKAFGDLDSSCDGLLSMKEFADSMKNIGFKPPMEDLDKTFWLKDLWATAAAEIPTFARKKTDDQVKKRKAVEHLPEQALELINQTVEAEDEHLRELISVVFKFLAPNNESEVSIQGFKVLESIWRELQQTTWELIRHLNNCFGSLAAAWDFADQSDDGELSLSEFKRLVRRFDFEGPIQHIFAHLDKDHDGSVSFDEFMSLDDNEKPIFR